MRGDAPQGGFPREGFGPPLWGSVGIFYPDQGLCRLRRLHPWLLSGRPFVAMGGKCRSFLRLCKAEWNAVWKIPYDFRD